MSAYSSRLLRGLLFCLPLLILFCSAGSYAQDDICAITPGTAQRIGQEIMNQAGHPYDSVSQAYYVSVLASRLTPYYVIYFIKDHFVVGEVEVDICGRQGTPHPGVQYADEKDVRPDQLLLEPDRAFATLRELTGAEAIFGSRVFPYGLTQNPDEWSGADFWWMILDGEGNWHYMTKLGKLLKLGTGARVPGAGPEPDSAESR